MIFSTIIADLSHSVCVASLYELEDYVIMARELAVTKAIKIAMNGQCLE